MADYKKAYNLYKQGKIEEAFSVWRESGSISMYKKHMKASYDAGKKAGQSGARDANEAGKFFKRTQTHLKNLVLETDKTDRNIAEKASVIARVLEDLCMWAGAFDGAVDKEWER